MADVKKIATRDSYGNALAALANEYPNLVVLDADLAGATKTATFKKACPERHIDCGIAEANMVGIAAGLASCGMIPFASSFAMFAAGRAFEQIRNSVGYPHANVKIGATHAGISVGEDGATHQCNEDIALMRTIPGMTVVNPSDGVSAKKLMKQVVDFDGPAYVRLGRAAVPVCYGEDDEIVLGKGNQVREGKDVTVIATGIMVNEALMAAEELAAEGIDVRVIDMHTIKPLDEEIIVKAARETGAIVTAEEHSVIGGLGSAVAEVVVKKCPVKMAMVGQQDTFGESGKPDELKAKYGMTAADIVKAVKGLR